MKFIEYNSVIITDFVFLHNHIFITSHVQLLIRNFLEKWIFHWDLWAFFGKSFFFVDINTSTRIIIYFVIIFKILSFLVNKIHRPESILSFHSYLTSPRPSTRWNTFQNHPIIRLPSSFPITMKSWNNDSIAVSIIPLFFPLFQWSSPFTPPVRVFDVAKKKVLS